VIDLYTQRMRRGAPAWLAGITYLPFGLFSGFPMIAMPFLLTARGVSLDHVAAITSVVLIPTFTGFLVVPMVDCGLSRRTWALIWAAWLGICAAGGILLLDRAAAGHAIGFTALLTAGSLGAQLYGSTMGGMTPNLIKEEDTAAASTWLNISNLGGLGLGGQMGILAVGHLGLHWGALVVGTVIAAPAMLLFVLGRERRVPRGFGETMRRLFPDLWAVSRTRAALIGLLIFITPAAPFAAINLFSGLGHDFHTSNATTTWLTGAGNSLLCCVGAFVGGWIADRMDRRTLFVGTGIVAAFASIGMAFGPRTAVVFCVGVGFYYLMAGINFVACSAAAFDIMGVDNPLSATQYALLMAACNVAIETVVVSDGRGYAHFGAKGLLMTDALFSLVTGAIMLIVIHLWGGTGREHHVSVDAAAEMV
jgi:PAT family beta-lactamase induction signal transducer AmpG